MKGRLTFSFRAYPNSLGRYKSRSLLAGIFDFSSFFSSSSSLFSFLLTAFFFLAAASLAAYFLSSSLAAILSLAL